MAVMIKRGDVSESFLNISRDLLSAYTHYNHLDNQNHGRLQRIRSRRPSTISCTRSTDINERRNRSPT